LKNNLVRECMKAYGFKEIKELSSLIGIPNTTVDTWDKNKPSTVGRLCLELLIENKHLKDKDEAVKKVMELYQK